ncbi:hypothetical protein, partial [Rhodanobacter lindaniclasticus]
MRQAVDARFATGRKIHRDRPETMRPGMVATGGAAGFALSRGVSFQGFIPAFPIIASTNQKM